MKFLKLSGLLMKKRSKMKTIAFRDIRGGTIHGYFKEGQTRHERIKEALAELKHVGCIHVYLVKGNKIRKLFTKKY